MASKEKTAATREDLEVSEKKAGDKLEVERNSINYTYTSYGKDELHDLYNVFETDLLAEFLLTESVSGGCSKFRLNDLIMIDDARIVCC